VAFRLVSAWQMDPEDAPAVVANILSALQEKGMDDLVHKHRGGEPAEDLIRRFLRSRKWKVPATLKLLVEDLEWREKQDVLRIRNSTASQMLKGDSNPAGRDLHHQLFPHGFLGHDKQGRAVVYKWWSKPFCAKTLENEGGLSLQDIINYNVWTMERTAAVTQQQGQWMYIIDLKGLALSNLASTRHVSYCKALADTDAAHFPERLARLFIVNAPSLFAGFWSLVQSWLDQATKQKVGLYASPETWKPELATVMDLELLPTHLGGKTVLSYTPRHSLDPPEAETAGAASSVEH